MLLPQRSTGQMQARSKTWIRWLLVIPVAVLADLGSQSLASGLLVGSLEVLHNARFVFRPYIDEFIWQAWAPVWFVWAGTKVAPAHRFQTSLALAVIQNCRCPSQRIQSTAIHSLGRFMGVLRRSNTGASLVESVRPSTRVDWCHTDCVKGKKRSLRLALGIRSKITHHSAVRSDLVLGLGSLGLSGSRYSKRERRVSKC